MNEDNEILLRLKIEQESSMKQLVELQKQINATKDELKSLDKSSADYAEKQVLLGNRLKDLNREQSLFTKGLQDNVKANKALEGSNDQLRAKLSQLTTAYNALGKEQRNSQPGIEFRNRIKAISDELKRNEEAIGDNRLR